MSASDLLMKTICKNPRVNVCLWVGQSGLTVLKLQPNIDVRYHQSSCLSVNIIYKFLLVDGGTRLIGVRQSNQIWLSGIISKLFHWSILVKFCYYNFWQSTWNCLLVGGWNLTDQGPAEQPNIDFQISPVKFVQIKICELLETKLKKNPL